jgi:hypothetical protein
MLDAIVGVMWDYCDVELRGPECRCNGCFTVKAADGWWCPHMENPEAVDVPLHQRWQRANALPKFLCKYPEA